MKQQKFFFFAILFFGLGLMAVSCDTTREATSSKKSKPGMEQMNQSIVGKYWKLVELNGQAIKAPKDADREPHFRLKKSKGTVSGNGGCNGFSGNYMIQEGMRIKFSDLISTMMYCEDAKFESDFMKALETADNYSVNGDMLSLNKARMAPLARFVHVEGK